MTLPRFLAPALLLLAAPAWAGPIPPLAPPGSFDSLAVPMPPMPAPPAPPRVEPPGPPVVIPPGAPVVIFPAQAQGQPQTAPQPPAQLQDAPADLFERGMEAVLDNVLREMQPTFDDMARGLDHARNTFGPALNDLGTLVDDIGNYQAPERLPNGDILIRRRADAPPPPPLGDALRDLATPRGDAATPPAAPPSTVPGTPTPVPPAADPPALARPVPAVPPGSQIDL